MGVEMNSLMKQLQEVVQTAQAKNVSLPYAEQYKQAEQIAAEIVKLQEQPTSTRQQDHALQLARLNIQQGVVLLDTDLQQQAEECISKGLPTLEQQHDSNASKSEDLEAMQSAYNGLGALWANRSEWDTAFQYLSKAQQLYQDAGSLNSEALEDGYTQTLFYLAQVHGNKGDAPQSAAYCGATLQRQLSSPELERSEWVQNCAQLAGFYTSLLAFPIAEHCIAAAQLVAAGAPHNNVTETEQKPTEAHPGSTEPSQPAASCGTTPFTQPVVDDDVLANLSLAAAKLCRQRLMTSFEYNVCRQSVNLPKSDSPLFASAPNFTSALPQLPACNTKQLDKMQDGSKVLADRFEEARDIFNQGMKHYNSALEYYKLDGWVTEHVTINLEISHMFRLLGGFETSASRRAAMHKQRIMRLKPLVGSSINQEHYLGLVRSVELESANAWRDCMEARLELQSAEGKKEQPDQTVANAASSAAQHYKAFMDTFTLDKPAYERVKDAEDEQLYVKSSFAYGRMRFKSAGLWQQGDRKLMILQEAVDVLKWTCEYVKRHSLTDLQRESSLAAEMAELIEEHIRLLHRQQQQLRE